TLPARAAQALVDAAALVEIRVVDQPLPALRGARLLERHAHHYLERVAQPFALFGEPPGVLERRARIVDRARPDHDEQPVVVVAHDRTHRRPALEHQPLDGRTADWEESDQVFRGREHQHLLDALVVDACVRVGRFGMHFGSLACDERWYCSATDVAPFVPKTRFAVPRTALAASIASKEKERGTGPSRSISASAGTTAVACSPTCRVPTTAGGRPRPTSSVGRFLSP